MCLILDTDTWNLFLNQENEDMKPVRHWLNKKNGKFVYSPIGKIKKELEKYRKMDNLYLQYRRNGKLVIINEEVVMDKKDKLPKLRSNDPDIIALALASGVKLLVSRDNKLISDFKQIVKGKCYKTKEHKHLLRNDTCP